MLKSMTVQDLESWRAYYELEPSFDQRADWLFASVQAMIHNSPREKKHQKPVREFLLKFETQEDRPKVPEWQRQKALMQMIITTHNNFVDSGQKEVQ